MKRAIGAMLSVILLFGLCACGKKETAATWQEQYDLGVRYLSEGNYEEAIIAFTAAIEIDPKNKDAYLGRASAYMESGAKEDNLTAAMADYQAVLEIDDLCADAYLGMAEIYIAQDEFDKAKEILQKGIDMTGDERLSARLEEIQSGNINDHWNRVHRATTYNGSGELLYYIEYTYLTGDNYWRYDTAASYDANGNQTGFAKCEYDENGNKIKSFYCFRDGTTEYIRGIEKAYDSDGHEIRSDWLDADGSLYQYTISAYDSAGNCVRWSVYGEDGKLKQENTWEYSSKGICMKETISYYHEGSLSRYSITEYNGSGQEVCTTDYDENGKTTGYHTFDYDEMGREIGVNFYDEAGNLRDYYRTEYGADGQRIKTSRYNGDGTLTEVTTYG